MVLIIRTNNRVSPQNVTFDPMTPTYTYIWTQLTDHLHGGLLADGYRGNTRGNFAARGVIPISHHTAVHPCVTQTCRGNSESHVTQGTGILNIRITEYLKKGGGGGRGEREGNQSR